MKTPMRPKRAERASSQPANAPFVGVANGGSSGLSPIKKRRPPLRVITPPSSTDHRSSKGRSIFAASDYEGNVALL